MCCKEKIKFHLVSCKVDEYIEREGEVGEPIAQFAKNRNLATCNQLDSVHKNVNILVNLVNKI